MAIGLSISGYAPGWEMMTGIDLDEETIEVMTDGKLSHVKVPERTNYVGRNASK
ncbi:hypothetical protein [Shewanella putrefaciens]|uniref:hypothetical protein n=1 Tax=Shewanella putrefaciens TaxID=24 RepID=UPI002861A78A|nr:hypothetical protein [Shewanella putrefaciens]MDR6965742.1 hypothetical protein [Shewanella putrefaciens]